MKIVLISDSHGNKLGVDRIFKEINFDYLFFMGDGLSDFGTYEFMDNVYRVSGNCDFFSTVDNELVIELGGKNFLITHGHRYGVKLGLSKLVSHAEEIGVDFVCYGHTHSQKIDKVGDIYFINPGSFFPKSDRKSYGLILTIEGDMVRIDDLIV